MLVMISWVFINDFIPFCVSKPLRWGITLWAKKLHKSLLGNYLFMFFYSYLHSQCRQTCCTIYFYNVHMNEIFSSQERNMLLNRIYALLSLKTKRLKSIHNWVIRCFIKNIIKNIRFCLEFQPSICIFFKSKGLLYPCKTMNFKGCSK